MHPSFFFFFSAFYSCLKALFFFSPTKHVCSVLSQQWPLEEERIRQTTMDALYPPTERMHEQNNSF